MIQFAPHLMVISGAMLLVIATMIKAEGLLNGLLFRLVPTILGAGSLWMSAALFMAAAS